MGGSGWEWVGVGGVTMPCWSSLSDGCVWTVLHTADQVGGRQRGGGGWRREVAIGRLEAIGRIEYKLV